MRAVVAQCLRFGVGCKVDGRVGEEIRDATVGDGDAAIVEIFFCDLLGRPFYDAEGGGDFEGRLCKGEYGEGEEQSSSHFRYWASLHKIEQRDDDGVCRSV